MMRLAVITAVVLATLGALMLLWQFRLALVLLAASMALTAALNPLIDTLAERHLRRGLAILITYLLTLALLLGVIFLAGRPLLIELARLTDNMAAAYEEIFMTWPAGESFQREVVGRLPEPNTLYQAITGEQGAALAQAIFGVAQGAFALISQISIVLVLSIYWSIDKARFERLWLSVLPSRQRSRARTIWQAIEKGVGSYVRSEMVQSLLAGILLWLGYTIMGLEYPTLLAVAGAILWLVPWLGAILAVVAPVLVGLSGGPFLSGIAAGYTLLVLLLLEVLIEPRFFKRRRYSSLLVVIIMVAMADVLGLAGLIIAPPLAAAIQILFTNLMRTSSPAETVNSTVQIKNLQSRLEALQENIATQQKPPPPEVSSLVSRLVSLVEETDAAFQTGEPTGPALGLPASSKTKSIG